MALTKKMTLKTWLLMLGIVLLVTYSFSSLIPLVKAGNSINQVSTPSDTATMQEAVIAVAGIT